MNTSEEGYELFRRAVVCRDNDAWEELVVNYRGLLMNWAVRTGKLRELGVFGEDVADEALLRAWMALSVDRFVDFPNLAALLAYLRQCVYATVIDMERSERVFQRAVRSAIPSWQPQPEQAVLAQMGSSELWKLITSIVMDESDRVVVYERFVLGLPPRVIQASHPKLFPDTKAVYVTLRNVLDRLRRNQELKNFRKQGSD